MNKKVITIVMVVALLALCALGVVYAPTIMEFVLRMHTIPQH
jgi:hypothetical protein